MIRRIILILIVVLMITLPFINKPFHIDDSLFIYSARSLNNNILLPYNFFFPAENRIRYGFTNFTNPALNAFFISLILKFFPEQPVILHSFFIIFTLFCAFSILSLSKLFVKNSLIATLAAITTPIYMLNSHTIMPDMALLGCWCYSIYFFIVGIQNENRKFILVSSIFMSLSLLLRYSGLLIIPLLMAYCFISGKANKKYMVYFAVPITVFILWCMHNIYIYGAPHILQTAKLSGYNYIKYKSFFPRVITSIIYIGSLMLYPVDFSILYVERRRASKVVKLSAVALLLCGFAYLNFWRHSLVNTIFYSIIVGFSLMFFLSIFIDLDKTKSVWREFKSSKEDIFLITWIILVVAFQSSAYFTAPKFMLLVLPPVICLFFRMAEKRKIISLKLTKIFIMINLIFGFIISFSDYSQAFIDSKVVLEILKENTLVNNTKVWVIDQDRNWGYYVPTEFSSVVNKHIFQAGDLVLGFPYLHFHTIYWHKHDITPMKVISIPDCLIRVVDPFDKVFLYYDDFGRYLPYSFGLNQVPMFVIWRVKERRKPSDLDYYSPVAIQ